MKQTMLALKVQRSFLQSIKRRKFPINQFGAREVCAEFCLFQVAAQKLGGGLDFVIVNHVYDIRFQKWTGSEQNLTEFDRAIDINMRAYVYLSSHATHILQKSGGGIVAVSAGWGRSIQELFHTVWKVLGPSETKKQVFACLTVLVLFVQL